RLARKLGIPVVAVVDTNCDPTEVDYVIPGNDDALRSIRLFTSKIAESIAEGMQAASDKQAGEIAAAVAAPEGADATPITSYEEGAEYHGEPVNVAQAVEAEAPGEDISMEEVMGAKPRKGPASASSADAAESAATADTVESHRV